MGNRNRDKRKDKDMFFIIEGFLEGILPDE
jgi:hypothetical protein